MHLGWGSLVAGFVCSALLCGSSACLISRRHELPEDNTVARHTFRPISILQRVNSTNDVIPLRGARKRLQAAPAQKQVFKSKTNQSSKRCTGHKLDDSLLPSSGNDSRQIKESDQTVDKCTRNFKSKTNKSTKRCTDHEFDDSLPPSSDYSRQIKKSDQTVNKCTTNKISQVYSPMPTRKIKQKIGKDTFVTLNDSSYCQGLVQSASGTWKHYL